MAATSRTPRPLDFSEAQRVVEAIEEMPETVGPIHLLKHGACKTYAVGEPESLDAVVIQSESLPEEPYGLGHNAQGLWDLLKNIDNWTAVNVSPAVSTKLGALIKTSTGKRVSYYGDVYHTLTKPVPEIVDHAVRELTAADIGLLEAAGVDGTDFGGLSVLLDEGSVAAAVVDGRIVGSAHTTAQTDRYADIGVGTDERWRNRGFATSAASIVARRIQESGRIPVWSCGEDNMASLRVAQKLGFTEVSRLAYVIKHT
ncbi:MAG: GNAT family N-acetyltransferase [Chloroflexota bacterium]|nr:GNAT family N-acetyltransferase [Chloroflexota bacterium]